jgi:hypothetical protein
MPDVESESLTILQSGPFSDKKAANREAHNNYLRNVVYKKIYDSG